MPVKVPAVAELGQPGQTSWSGWLETFEATPDLRFPLSAVVYDQMRRSDAQVDSVLRAITLPIRRTRWSIQGDDDVRPEVVSFVEAELGLAADGRRGRARRQRTGVVFDDVLRHALLMLPFGFMPLEQVYEAGPPLAGQEVPPGTYAHLRKLAPRMPRTITGVHVARDGGLERLTQQVVDEKGFPREVDLPVDRLVVFVNDREGGDWTGRSILRSSWPHHLIKTQLLRLGPMAVERNGMGVPIVYYGEGGSEETALRLAKAIRAGEEAGAGVPDSYRVELLGVTGQTRDELPLLKYHDEAIGRSALAMFLNLGHDNGARALGETFVDYFLMAEQAVVEEIGATLTEYVVRDLVALNFGEEEAYPEVVADEITSSEPATADALKTLVDAQLLTPDNDLEVELRRRLNLPPGAPRPQRVGDVVPIAPVDDGPPPDVIDPAAIAARAAAVAERMAKLAEGRQAAGMAP